MKASRLMSFTGPPAILMSVWQGMRGSATTRAAARSQRGLGGTGPLEELVVQRLEGDLGEGLGREHAAQCVVHDDESGGEPDVVRQHVAHLVRQHRAEGSSSE